jgi:hypothetical protein
MTSEVRCGTLAVGDGKALGAACPDRLLEIIPAVRWAASQLSFFRPKNPIARLAAPLISTRKIHDQQHF